MPVQIGSRVITEALASLPADAARAAAAAARALGRADEEAPWTLRRYDLARYCWTTLPRQDPRATDTIDALARLLAAVGGRAAAYAQEVCRSPQAGELLALWRAGDPTAPRRARMLLEGTGLEPPDTPLLRWSDEMGPAERAARERVITAMEEAVETGRLARGTRGYRAARIETAEAALRGAAFDAIARERAERWIAGRGSAPRRELLEPLAEAVQSPPRPAASGIDAPLWLLTRGPIELTATGALPRALVQEAVERWPEWWPAVTGTPAREDEVPALGHLDRLLRNMRLLRPQGSRLVRTPRGTELAEDPEALVVATGEALLAGGGFRGAVAELTAALLLTGDTRAGELGERILGALYADGWRAAGSDEPPDSRDVAWLVADVTQTATGLGFVRGGVPGQLYELTDTGRTGLLHGLRARAVAPFRSR